MSAPNEKLWRYGTRSAIVAALPIWLVMTVLFTATRTYIGWPDEQSQRLAALVVLSLGLLPLVLHLLDFAASRRAVLDIKGVKLDFSRLDLGQPEVRRESPGIPDNIGVSGPIVSDTSPMNIIETLKDATANEIVVIDLKAGDAWWVTRLLALSAGAVRAGSPEAFVFVGKRANRDHQFLGVAEPKDVLQGILAANDEYRARYEKATRIARQVVMYGNNELLPQQPDPFSLHTDVRRYTNDPQFATLGDAVTEQVLMDQLALSTPCPSLEVPPDRLTLGRLNDLFGHCLSSDAISLDWPKEKQISVLLNSVTPYVPLVRDGQYESVIRRDDGRRLLLRELFQQSLNADFKSPTAT